MLALVLVRDAIHACVEGSSAYFKFSTQKVEERKDTMIVLYGLLQKKGSSMIDC